MTEIKIHTLHIRKLDDETYRLMWAMRKQLKAKSWADMMKKICDTYKEEIAEFEWL
ncbi:hypothetical protein ES705_26862 [subsurface metagenome]